MSCIARLPGGFCARWCAPGSANRDDILDQRVLVVARGDTRIAEVVALLVVDTRAHLQDLSDRDAVVAA